MYKAIRNTLLVGARRIDTRQLFDHAVHRQAPSMTFFVTSVGSGKGADLGGLEGADQHCQSLAKAAGAGNRTWRAYLSTQGRR